jgi:hypothetical protein
MVHPHQTTNITDVRDGTSKGAAFKLADWVTLSATPLFGIMALLTAAVPSGPMEIHASRLTGMVTMYLLMSFVHSAHWLKLFSGDGSC